jgi:hypothetical protein
MNAINGFVIDIYNETNQSHPIQLFINSTLPDGVKINLHNSEFDHQLLQSLAKSKGFIGNGISADQVLRFTIRNGLTTEKFHDKFLTDKEILIDGFSNYVEVEIPAATSILFQLMPRV